MAPRGGDDHDRSPASQKQLIVGLTEIDSEIRMEYGLILPRPGDEPACSAANAPALDGIQGTCL
jgi:hypothetical protein